MRLAFSSIAFGRYTLLETISILAGQGYEGIEIMADRPHAFPPDLAPGDVRALRKALDVHHLQVSNINAFMLNAIGDVYHPSWIEADPALRERRIEHTLDCIELAHELGAKTVSTEPGGPLLMGQCHEDSCRLFLDGLHQIEDRARKRNILILIEPEPRLLIENSRQFLKFFKNLDPEVFGLNFDIGHFFCVSEDPACLIRSGLQKYIRHFHLEDIAATREHVHLMLGEGAVDIPGVLTAIREIGYDGFVTVELYPYEDRAIEAAKATMDYLRSCARGIFFRSDS
jgi:sugar phosphate isomerase/epimerase